jgi:hypothetical protein
MSGEAGEELDPAARVRESASNVRCLWTCETRPSLLRVVGSVRKVLCLCLVFVVSVAETSGNLACLRWDALYV